MEADAMKIAIATWDNRISTVFDAADELLIIDEETKGSTAKSKISLTDTTIIDKAALIRELGTDVLICGALPRPIEYMISAAGVQVLSFIRGPVDEVIEAFRNGGLADHVFVMPGCRRGMGRGQKGVCMRGVLANRGGR